jgi:hypothetical protein
MGGHVRVLRAVLRRAPFVLVLLLSVASAQALVAPAQDGWAAQSDLGSWTAPIDVGVIGIHATLMPNGKVLLFQRPAEGTLGSIAKVFDPVSGDLTEVSFLTERDVFCSDHNVLPDGRVFVAGGHRHGSTSAGVASTELFDPATDQWSDGPTLTQRRWYPTNVELGDGSTLVFGGQGKRGKYSDSVDRFDPVTDSIARLGGRSSHLVGLYPRMTLLPDGRILWAGGTKTGDTGLFTGAQVFNVSTKKWTTSAPFQYGQRNAPNAVLLPGLTKFLVMGGGERLATDTVEIMDTTQRDPAWEYTTPMNHARRNANSVLLPDGTVLEVGGGLKKTYVSPQLTPEIFDPATMTWTDMAPQVAPRMYHSTALLLPDGRVLSAGQDKDTAYGTTVEIYSPPYLFHGDRPTIDAAPTGTTYGSTFSIASAAAADIGHVVLIHPGSVSHGNDSNQRVVDLQFGVAGDGTLTVTAPPDGNTAPPGWYMLFLVDSSGVPSVASWIHVDTTIQPGGSVAPVPATQNAFDRTSAAGGGPAAGSEAVIPSGVLPTDRKTLARLHLICHIKQSGDGL